MAVLRGAHDKRLRVDAIGVRPGNIRELKEREKSQPRTGSVVIETDPSATSVTASRMLLRDL